MAPTLGSLGPFLAPSPYWAHPAPTSAGHREHPLHLPTTWVSCPGVETGALIHVHNSQALKILPLGTHTPRCGWG